MENIKKEQNSGPLLSWDIYFDYYNRLMKRMNDKIYLEKFLQQHYVKIPGELMKCVNTYDAIVITDTKQIIQWVSSGFYHMTGYTFDEAIYRKPSFLQGSKTSETIKIRIREAILKSNPVSETLVNYRKSGIEYDCQVNIEPVFDHKKDLTHFMAFEKKI